MNEFLERIKLIAKNNPSLLEKDFNNIVYSELISFNLGHNQERFKDVEYLFEQWINRSNNVNNLMTFVSPKFPYFCQFANKNAVNIAKEAIKLYIPLDDKHLYRGANRLFNFIASEGIHHNSKIGKKIRNDNVVVRVSNIEEAEKVINFVKNDPYIQDGLLNTNPFTINIDGVGIAKDGMRSYNTELCNFLTKFINILVSKNRLDDLNVVSFHEYLASVKDFGDEDLQTIAHLQSEITSGRQLSLEDFKSIIKGYSLEEVNKEDIFKNVVKLTYEKYGLNHTINAIARYRYNGNDSGFTRDKGARYQLTINRVTREDVNNFLANFNMESNNVIEDYINAIVNKKKNVLYYLSNAYRETYIKYGVGQAEKALRSYILNGDTKFITNNNNARNNLKENVRFDRLYDSLRNEMGIDAFCTLEELIETLLEEMNKNYSNRFSRVGNL